MRTWIIAALILLPSVARAQMYHFAVPEAEVTVGIEADGSALIHYRIVFECMEGAHDIDVVDIGMPDMGPHEALGASIGGQDVDPSAIRISTYLEPRGSGYEVDLGMNAIRPGERAVFTFQGREHSMVWEDLTDPDLVSFRFTPTWFGAEYVSGGTELTVRYVLPIPAGDYPAVKDRILWQREGEEFSVKGVMEGEDRVSVAWARTVSFTGPHVFSVSFPASYVTEVRADSHAAALVRWLEDATPMRVFLGILVIGLFGIVFFVFTRRTGWSVFLVLAALMGVAMYLSVVAQLVILGVVIVLGLVLVGAWMYRRGRRPRYFKAELDLEGGGIKRGLTAVQAAVLLELPLSKVLTMIVFGLARKGVVQVVKPDPLELRVVGKLTARSEKKGGTAWRMPDERIVDLRPYEPAFLEAFRAQAGVPVEQMTLDVAFEKLIGQTAEEMLTFDLDDTRKYYRSIVSRAWDQVKAEADWEARFKRVDRQVDWLIMDDDWQDSWKTIATPGRAYHPIWWYGSTPRVSAGAALPSMAADTSPTSGFGDVASGLVGRLENVSQSAVQTLDGLGVTEQGGLDLSAVDTFTKDTLDAMFTSSGSGGGGGGCACACAGCACACACAGGGR